jgi:predicted nucleic acid-binding protein
MNREETIFLDTSALIPLLTESHCNHYKVRRYLKETKCSCCIDSIVLSEFLTGAKSPKEKRVVLDIIARQFRVLSLSVIGAQIGAQIFKCLKEKGVVPKGKTDRQITRVDVLILASAIENRVNTILYEDNHFFSMIQHVKDIIIPNYSIPNPIRIVDIPGDLFDNISN